MSTSALLLITTIACMFSAANAAWGRHSLNQDCQPSTAWQGKMSLNDCVDLCDNGGFTWTIHPPDNNCKCSKQCTQYTESYGWEIWVNSSTTYSYDDSTAFPVWIIGPIVGCCIIFCCIMCCVVMARSNGSAGTAHNAPPPVFNSGSQGGGIVSNPLMIGTAVVGSAAVTGILAHQMSNNSNNAHDGGGFSTNYPPPKAKKEGNKRSPKKNNGSGFTTNDLPPTYDAANSNAAWGLDP